MKCGSAPPNRNFHTHLCKVLRPARSLSTRRRAEGNDSTHVGIVPVRHLATDVQKSVLREFLHTTHWPGVFSNAGLYTKLRYHKEADQGLPNLVARKSHILYLLLYCAASIRPLGSFGTLDACGEVSEL